MARLHLYLLGPPQAELEDSPVDIQRRKVWALLVYLAVTGQPQRRDTLATLLWPDSSQSEARAALTLRTGAGGINNGRDLTWRVGTSGYSGLQVSFATRRSAAGFNSNQFQYTLDGATFVNFGQPFDPGGTFAVVSFDLRHIRALNDNPNAGFRIVFNGGSSSSASEFTLIDNLRIVGK